MRSTRLTLGGAALAALAAFVPAEGTADSLFVSARAESLSPGGPGGGGRAEWHHGLAGGRTLTLAGSAFTLPGAQWGSGSAGLSAPLGALWASVDLTGGHSTLEGAYWHARGGLLAPVHRRLALQAGVQGMGGGAARGVLVEGGAVFELAPAITLQGTAFHSLSGPLETRMGVAKIVITHGRRRYFAGATAGRTVPAALGLRNVSAAQHLGHVFVGAALPVSRGADELMLAVERYDLEVASRVQLVVGWKFAFR